MGEVIVIGAGGHARTIGNILKLMNNIKIINFIDCFKKDNEKIVNKDVIQVENIITYIQNQKIQDVVLALGDNKKREYYFKELNKRGYNFLNVIHPTAIIEDNVKLGNGVVIGAGVILGAEVIIKNNTIINNGVIVDHESIIGNNVHIAPGTKIAGRVIIGNNTFIGVGSSIIDNISIGKNVIAGAGSVIIKDIEDNAKVVGVPAKRI
ncbi:hypothetical protein U472_03475 [Orenia metallireducens]|uniref:PglD N-terminal domain-containing protein n=1 Tax=Orenia metallireducens TaxID=1413210 RepID=A0A1C0ABB3_9FIRM|nr:acetyltransferase [Orenia metallireducens]OCL27624.1 hypothetical protein U472_03475 [Orenia metallireducens]